MGPGNRLLERLLTQGTTAVADDAGGRWRRIRIEGAPGLNWTPGQQIRVQVGELSLRSPRDLLRTYSLWDYADDALELRVFLHGEGPGAQWARNAQPGTEVMFKAPEGRFVLRDSAPGHLFVGEETASAAFGSMMRALHGPARAIVETGDPADRLPLDGEVTWVDRGGSTAHNSTQLVEAVDSLEALEPGTVAYLAGEAKTVQAVKHHLLHERRWPRRDIVTKPFWTPGRRGMD